MKYAAKEYHWTPQQLLAMSWEDLLAVFTADEVQVSTNEVLDQVNKERVAKGLPKVKSLNDLAPGKQ